MSNSIALLGRILMAAIFLQAGVHKALAFKVISAMLAGKGFPAPDIMTALTILVEIVGGLLLLPLSTARYGAAILAPFTLVAGAFFHDFWHKPPAEYANDFNHFMKNIAIIGGFLCIMAQPAGSRLTRP